MAPQKSIDLTAFWRFYYPRAQQVLTRQNASISLRSLPIDCEREHRQKACRLRPPIHDEPHDIRATLSTSKDNLVGIISLYACIFTNGIGKFNDVDNPISP